MTSGRTPLPREHGTNRGYKQHEYNNEPACQPCKDAAAAYRRALYVSKRKSRITVSKFERRRRDAASQKQRRLHQKAIVNQWKLNQQHCADCELQITEQILPAIDCDHIDPNKKSFSISESCGAVTDQQLLTELNKCQARCRNCHAIRTMEEGHWFHRNNGVHVDENQMRLFDAS
jgi:hypothetical protein